MTQNWTSLGHIFKLLGSETEKVEDEKEESEFQFWFPMISKGLLLNKKIMNLVKSSVSWIVGAAILFAMLSSLAIDFFEVGMNLGQKLIANLLILFFFGFQLLAVIWLDKRFGRDRSSAPASIEYPSSHSHFRQRFLVKQGQKLLSIKTKEIAWIHAEGKLCYCKTWDNHRYFLEYSLEELNEMLDSRQFFRINRAYIVQFKAIKNISHYFNSKLILQLHPATEGNDVIISKEKAAEFKHWLGK